MSISNYAVAIVSHEVILEQVKASNKLNALIQVLTPMEGFEEWQWQKFTTLKELERELAECDITVGILDIYQPTPVTLYSSERETKMSGPIKPEDVVRKFPEAAFDAFNEMITAKWDGIAAVFEQKEVADLIASKLNSSRQAVYDSKFLDVEDSYRKEGWCVYYNKPERGESFEPYFRFRKKVS